MSRGLKRREQRRHEWVVDFVQNRRLSVQTVKLVAVDDFLLGQNLQCERDILLFGEGNQVHGAHVALSNALYRHEVVDR